MPQIEVLDEQTIDKIAAGEVVERPSSVVKELVENAIDAKATAITVEIKEGGTSLIRITDNGCGIEAAQIPIAFYRHSTSKIRKVEDLVRISSLGFRGEALSSIAAVAQVELITKTPEQFTGSRYLIEGGKEVSLAVVGLDAEILRHEFSKVPDVYGEFQNVDKIKMMRIESGYQVIVFINFENYKAEYSFAYDENGKVVGIYFK